MRIDKMDIEKLLYKDIQRQGEHLKDDQQKYLVAQYKKGDTKALHLLVSSNLKFIMKILMEYRGYGVTKGELLNCGVIGLITAAKKYTAGNSTFLSYAVFSIRKQLQIEIFKSQLIRLPENKAEELKAAKKKISKGMSVDDSILQEIVTFVSMDAEDDETGKTLHDIIPCKSQEELTEEEQESRDRERKKLHENLLLCISELTEREQYIIKNSFGIGDKKLSINEIAENLGIDQQLAYVIRNKALNKLRNWEMLLRS